MQNSENTTLLIPAEQTLSISIEDQERLTAIHHYIFSVIYKAGIAKERDKEPSSFWYYFKMSLGVVLLSLRGTSILFRLFAAKEFVRVFFQIWGLNKVPNNITEDIAIGLSSIFFLADLVVTLRSTKKAVFPLCKSDDWILQGKIFFSDIKTGQYPKAMLLSGLAAMMGSASKGYSGILTMFSEELSDVPFLGKYLKLISPKFSFVAATSSAICFFLFQFCDKACFVLNSYRSLKEYEHFEEFYQENAKLISSKNRQGMLLNVGAGLFSAIAIFYSQGHFEFHPEALALFFVIAIGTIYFNYYYTYNEVHKLDVFKKIHEKEICGHCETVTATKKTTATRIIGSIGAVGDALTYMLSVVKTFQMILHFVGMITKDDDKWKAYANNEWAIFSFVAASIPIAIPAGLQGWSLWTGGLFSRHRPIEFRSESNGRSADSISVMPIN